MKDKVISYLKQKKWRYKERTGSAQMSCPFKDCEDYHDKGHHFYIYYNNEIYTCHKCGKRGHLLKLKRLMGDLNYIKREGGIGRVLDISLAEKYHQALLKNEEALEYLKSRGYTDELIKEEHLGFALRERHGEEIPCITFPTYFKDRLSGLKYKSLRKYANEKGGSQYIIEQEPGTTAHLYGGHLLDPKNPRVYVVEGEYDRGSAKRYKMKNVVSVPAGATGFGSWVEELDGFHKIYLMMDNDEAGDRGSKELAKKLGKYRCYRVHLPLKDMNECLCAGVMAKEIQECVAKAENYGDDDTVSVDKVIKKLDDLYELTEESKGKKPKFGQFQKTLAGWRDAEWTVLTGETTSGKSTMSLNLVHEWLEAGEGVLICSAELLTKKVLAKLVSIHLGKDFYDKEQVTPEEYQEAREWLLSKTLFFIDVYGSVSLTQIEDAVEMTSKLHHVKRVVLDHLHFFINREEKEYEAISKFTKGIEDLCKRTETHIITVVHPKQVGDSEEIRTNGMCLLRGSPSIKQDADNIAILWRDADAELKGTNHVEFIWNKIRDDSAKLTRANSVCHFYFDPRSQRYYEKVKRKKKEKLPSVEEC